MNENPLKKFELQETALQRAVRELQPMSEMLSEQDRIARMVDPYRGMLEEATRTNRLIEEALSRSSVADLTAQTAAVAEQFRLPELSAITALQKSLTQPTILEALDRYHLQADVVIRAMAHLKSPWLNLQDQLSSVAALTELHGMGHALASLPSFDNHVTAALRIDLGDWRRPLALDLAALLNPITRSELYIARGFDPALTDFPAPAFRDGLASAGLYEPPEVPDAEPESDETEAGFMRTNEAHNRLMRFEYHLRLFIDDAMTLAVGPDWIKHRVPEPMRTAWEDKKKRGLAAGEAEQPLIGYADFTDYVAIIIRRDNWRDVFGAMFQHKPSVEESFRRLYPVRICTMHARPITADDALFLLVELKRLNKVIGFEP